MGYAHKWPTDRIGSRVCEVPSSITGKNGGQDIHMIDAARLIRSFRIEDKLKGLGMLGGNPGAITHAVLVMGYISKIEDARAIVAVIEDNAVLKGIAIKIRDYRLFQAIVERFVDNTTVLMDLLKSRDATEMDRTDLENSFKLIVGKLGHDKNALKKIATNFEYNVSVAMYAVKMLADDAEALQWVIDKLESLKPEKLNFWDSWSARACNEHSGRMWRCEAPIRDAKELLKPHHQNTELAAELSCFL